MSSAVSNDDHVRFDRGENVTSDVIMFAYAKLTTNHILFELMVVIFASKWYGENCGQSVSVVARQPLDQPFSQCRNYRVADLAKRHGSPA